MNVQATIEFLGSTEDALNRGYYNIFNVYLRNIDQYGSIPFEEFFRLPEEFLLNDEQHLKVVKSTVTNLLFVTLHELSHLLDKDYKLIQKIISGKLLANSEFIQLNRIEAKCDSFAITSMLREDLELHHYNTSLMILANNFDLKNFFRNKSSKFYNRLSNVVRIHKEYVENINGNTTSKYNNLNNHERSLIDLEASLTNFTNLELENLNSTIEPKMCKYVDLYVKENGLNETNAYKIIELYKAASTSIDARWSGKSYFSIGCIYRYILKDEKLAVKYFKLAHQKGFINKETLIYFNENGI